MLRSVFSPVVLAVFCLPACTSPTPAPAEGNDTDGQVACPGPECAEDCGDEIDNDQDGLEDCFDPDCVTVCDFDADNDGFEDVVFGGEDCDDSDPAVNPDATEVCDGVDNDCNELVDEDDLGLDTSTLTDWYPDQDIDGYGDQNSSSQRACEGPSGSVADNTDCNDDDSAVNPGAIDDPGDCIDDDCDGYIVDTDCGLALYMVRESDGMLRKYLTGSNLFVDIGLLGVSFDYGELAYDEVAGVMYMLDGAASNALYTVDLNTGAATLVGVHGTPNLYGLAISSAGDMYATDGVDAGYYRVDRAVGSVSELGITRPAAGLTWDTTRDTLVGLNSINGDVAEIDVLTGLNTWLGNSGPIDHCGFAYDSDSDLFWAVDQGGFLYTYDPNNGYARTVVLSNLGAHDGLAVGP